jgi:hypothetical protein
MRGFGDVSQAFVTSRQTFRECKHLRRRKAIKVKLTWLDPLKIANRSSKKMSHMRHILGFPRGSVWAVQP